MPVRDHGRLVTKDQPGFTAGIRESSKNPKPRTYPLAASLAATEELRRLAGKRAKVLVAGIHDQRGLVVERVADVP